MENGVSFFPEPRLQVLLFVFFTLFPALPLRNSGLIYCQSATSGYTGGSPLFSVEGEERFRRDPAIPLGCQTVAGGGEARRDDTPVRRSLVPHPGGMPEPPV